MKNIQEKLETVPIEDKMWEILLRWLGYAEKRPIDTTTKERKEE